MEKQFLTEISCVFCFLYLDILTRHYKIDAYGGVDPTVVISPEPKSSDNTKGSGMVGDQAASHPKSSNSHSNSISSSIKNLDPKQQQLLPMLKHQMNLNRIL